MLALLSLALLSLDGCSLNPIKWFRDTTGSSKNDPGPDAPNAQNLEAGGNQPFPNLGSVPPPPNRALSLEEREALTQKLIADRANAKYIDDQLRIGPTASAAPPPPAPGKSPPTPAPAVAAAPPPAPVPAVAAPPPPVAPAAAASPATKAAAATEQATPEPPHESSLTSPEIANLPQPETPRAPPPPPSDLTGGASAPAAPVPAAVTPQPASEQLASRPAAAAAPQEPVSGAPVAQIAFADNSARLSPAEQRKLDDIVPLQRRNGGLVRVVGYAPKPRSDGASQQLASFRMALERANAVATALAQAGIAAGQIAVEAAPPSGTGIAAQRAEIFLEN